MGACISRPSRQLDDHCLDVRKGNGESKDNSVDVVEPVEAPSKSATARLKATVRQIKLPYESQAFEREDSVSKGEQRTLKSRRPSNAELAGAVAFWEDNCDLSKLTCKEIAQRYSRDHGLLLESLEYVEEVVRSTATQPKQQKPVPCDSEKDLKRYRSSDELSPATPAEQDTQAHSSSVQSSPRTLTAANDTPEPSTAADLPGASIRKLLHDHALITGARCDYENGRMKAAQRKLLQWCKQHAMALTELQPDADVIGFDIEELQAHCQKIEEMLRALQDETGYSTARDDGALRVLHKCVKGRVHYIKMEATLPHPLERPLSLAREFDLMSTWNHYVRDSSLLHAPSIWQSWVYAGMWMPFPFPQMDALAKGRGYDVSEEDRSLLVYIESVQEEELPEGCQKLPAQAQKRRRVTVLPGSTIRLEPLPPTQDGTSQTKGTVIAVVDPHIPHVPSFIINFVLGVVAPFAHRQIVKLLRDEFDDPDKEFPKRMAASPELYERVRKVVNEGFAKYYGLKPSE